MQQSSVIIVGVVLRLGWPYDETKADDIWLVIVNTVAADYFFVFLEFVTRSFSFNKGAFYTD